MFYLHIGCIQNGRITSRDSEVRQFDTLKEAEQSYRESKSFWASIGYQVWFANVKNEAGEIVKQWAS